MSEVAKGAQVRITRGRNSGQVGVVFWLGPDKFGEGSRCGVAGDDGETYWLDATHVVLDQRSEPPRSRSDADEEHILHDLKIGKGKRKLVAQSLVVHGWVEVEGTLSCKSLRCLGLEVSTEATCCADVVEANFVEACRRSNFEVRRVRALVINHEEMAMKDCDLEGRLVQHDAGDMNPSWERLDGDLSVLPAALYERRSENNVFFDVRSIRQALGASNNPFQGVEPLVQFDRAKEKYPKATNPLLGELEIWFQQHAGPQRQTLEDLASWHERLRSLSAADAEHARKLIKKRIKSPKLKSKVQHYLDSALPE